MMTLNPVPNCFLTSCLFSWGFLAIARLTLYNLLREYIADREKRLIPRASQGFLHFGEVLFLAAWVLAVVVGLASAFAPGDFLAVCLVLAICWAGFR